MTEDTTRLDNPILHWPNDPRIPGCNEHCHRAEADAPDAGLRGRIVGIVRERFGYNADAESLLDSLLAALAAHPALAPDTCQIRPTGQEWREPCGRPMPCSVHGAAPAPDPDSDFQRFLHPTEGPE